MAFSPEQIAQLTALMTSTLKSHVDPLQANLEKSLGHKVEAALDKKIDPVLDEIKGMKSDIGTLQRKQMELEGKQHSSELFKMWSMYDGLQKWYQLETDRMFELRSTICAFGPVTPPAGKTLFSVDNLRAFISENLVGEDASSVHFTYGTYGGGSRAVLKIFAVHSIPAEARRIAASVMKTKDLAKKTFGAHLIFDKPKALNLIQQKTYRIFDLLVASGVTKKGELTCSKGMIQLGMGGKTPSRSLFPECLIHAAVADESYQEILATKIPSVRAYQGVITTEQLGRGLLLAPVLHLVVTKAQVSFARALGIPVMESNADVQDYFNSCPEMDDVGTSLQK